MKSISVDPEIQGMIDEWEPNSEYPLSVIATTDKKGNVTFAVDHADDEMSEAETPAEPEPEMPAGKMSKPMQKYIGQMK